MSLLDELANNGVSAEDLEKAASVRLFEQAAADEGIDFNEMNDDEVVNLYNYWLDADGEVEGNDDDVEEAHAKLAEAEILGRHMARAFTDEQEKLADYDDDDDLPDNIEVNPDELSLSEFEALEELGYVFEKDAAAVPIVRPGGAGRGTKAVFGYLPKGKSYAQKAWEGTKATLSGSRSKATKARLKDVSASNVSAAERAAKLENKIKARSGGSAFGGSYRTSGQQGHATRKRNALTKKMEGMRAKALESAGRGAKTESKARSAHRGALARQYGSYAAGATGVGLGAKKLIGKSEKTASEQIYDNAVGRANEFIEYGTDSYDDSLLDNFAVELLVEEGYSFE